MTLGAIAGTSGSFSGGLTATDFTPTASQAASTLWVAPVGGGVPTRRQLTTADISGIMSGLLAINAQTAAYTFSTANGVGGNDCLNTLVTDTVTGTAGHSDTIPLGLPQGCVLRLAQMGTDPVTIAGVSGVTILSPGTPKLTGANTSLKAVVTSASNASAETVLLSSGL